MPANSERTREPTSKHQKQRQTFPILPTAAPAVYLPYNGHPGRGSTEVSPLQFARVLNDSFSSRALALSLEDTTAEEQFQADLQQALQESQSQSQSTPPQHGPQIGAANESSKPNSFLSERAQLEKERLARQKRLRGDAVDRASSQAPTPSTSTADSESDDDGLEKPASKRQHLATPRQSRTLRQSKPNESIDVVNETPKLSTSSRTSTNLPWMFWKGEIRQTANMHVDPNRDTKPTFRLSDIIGEVRLTIFLRLGAVSLRAVAGRCSLRDYFFLLNRLRVCLQNVLNDYASHHHISPCHREQGTIHAVHPAELDQGYPKAII